jgi:hypothetical protein
MSGIDKPGPAGSGDRPDRDDAEILEFDLADRSSHWSRELDPATKAGRLVEQARKRYDASDYPGAIGLLDEAIGADPTYVYAWLWKARCLARARNLPRAIAELERGRAQVQGERAVARIERMLDACRRHLTDRPIEEARRDLRAERAVQALVRLDECAATLAGNKTFQTRHTYALERAQNPAARDSTQLTHAQLQEVLAWLCREEMEHGARAFAAEDFLAAANSFAHARKRDGRFTVAAFDQAQAMLCLAVTWTQDLPPAWTDRRDRLRQIAKLLGQADSLASEAAINTAIAADAASLSKQIAATAREIAEMLKRAEKIVSVNECIGKYNGLIDHLQRNTGNPLAINAFITSFPAVEARAHRLLGLYGAEDADVGRQLRDLVAAVKRTRQSIAW